MRKLMLAVLLCSSAVFAMPPMPGEPPCPHGAMSMEGKGGMGKSGAVGPGEHLPPYLTGIALSDEQKNQLAELLKSRRQPMQDLGKQEHQAKEALLALSFSNDYSSDKAAPMIAKLAQLHSNMLGEISATDNAVFKLLTAEQLAVLKGHRQANKP
ncbi:Spy/CpxP family protein refolding chaperone [Methylomonas rhizoryzae]|uniref:Spy/CpxP family protein refolding chaperone n=1 Tax=Methylomonas rhizoryzae TaxID=2608981 RepID=UPI0012326C31|nr:Spy/CpxP family protein refolding chaperone [Methylomonas rhizoryzae]